MIERAYLAQLESANTDELSQMLRRPAADEERLLEVYFGRESLQRLRSLALGAQRRATPRGNVVVLHGIMGGELTVFPTNQASQSIWLHFVRLAVGGLGWLRMTPDARSQFDVRPTGILKKWYAEMLLGLAADRWNVQAFWFDWRLDLAESADRLKQQIDRWFGPDAPVNLVAHSMGGLVSRTYILRHPERWKKGGKLIMLGTPNHGSFAIPQVITGALDTVRKLAVVDVTHSRLELAKILNTFPGSFQMLPSPLVMAEMDKMYQANLWGDRGVAQRLLDTARASHERLAKVVDGERMTYIAGYNQVTKSGVADWARLDDVVSYSETLDGDGSVPHSLGFLHQGTKRIPTFFVECEHGALPNHRDVILGTQQLLAGAKCSLPTAPSKMRGPDALATLSAERRAREIGEEEALREMSRRVRGRSRAAGTIGEAPLSREEVAASEVLVRSFLSAGDARLETAKSVPPTGLPPVGVRARTKPVAISIRLVRSGIDDAQLAREADAIAVGHYLNVAPQNAELALDKAMSAARPARKERSDEDFVITGLHRRGVIGGELGQNFTLPDPRNLERLIVLAGMGQPGTFRESELTVLARELVWMLGHLGREHLLTVLIGAGVGNLETKDAARAWLRGIRRALLDASALMEPLSPPPTKSEPTLRQITFVENSAANFLLLHRAFLSSVAVFENDSEVPMIITYIAPTAAAIKAAQTAAEKAACEQGIVEMRKSLEALTGNAPDPEPVRLTIRLTHDSFEFAAMTADASIPQRDTQIDPGLVDEVNNQLPVTNSFNEQFDRGHLLGKLLVPRDLRQIVARPGAPLVLALDATTARIHWEMISLAPAGGASGFDRERFLGTVCGLTRQLRTNFAPLPEPPMLTSRALRVLVIADPAEDAPLPGAQEEGEAVAAIFEEFGREPSREVEVVRLFGPAQATRATVLDQLVNHRFDVLHFAGHCLFDANEPANSGWLFSRGEKLNAYALNRIDRIPRFVFSNACESGITPDRADKRSAMLAPSFAEAFFGRGVANFICTAWPVDDAAALEFARRFYRGILGLRDPGIAAEALHEAMREARADIAKQGLGGLQTWGAYQHYGDPCFRFVPRGSQREPQQRADPAPKATPKPRKRRGK